jgi:23S rRNA pseudouridine1911/1915/1917 synthase
VHRLDQDTSGLMIVARNKEAGLAFENLFKERKIHKIYRALCFGKPKEPSGTINFAIGKDAKHPNKYRAIFQNIDKNTPRKPPQNKKNTPEKSAVTNYVLLHAWNRGVCEIQCSPLTGRTHQVRVHLSAIGCPLLGDKTYAHNLPGHGAYKMALRHMLHAWKLEFKYKGQNYAYEAPLAKDYQDVLNTLK